MVNRIRYAWLALVPGLCAATCPFGSTPDWQSNDSRGTCDIVVADFNSDGWQTTVGEAKNGDGHRHCFYLKHFPVLTITAVRVNGAAVSRANYCYDDDTAWVSLKIAPPAGANVEFDYRWSNRLDLFAANEIKTETDGKSVIYFNKGTGLDPEPVWYSVEEWGGYSDAADYDRDGDVDVALDHVIAWGDERVLIYKNNGTGLENTASVSLGPFKSITALAWGDVNNDGYPDLAVGDWHQENETVFVYKNNGGVIESTPSYKIQLQYVFDLAWGDAENDGDLDLAAATYAPSGNTDIGYVYVFKNVAGELETAAFWRNDPPVGRCSGLTWGDANNDGELDLVKGICGEGGTSDRYADIYFSENGVLHKTPDWESQLYSYNHESILIDCDGNGKNDLLQPSGGGIHGYFYQYGSLEEYPSFEYRPGSPYVFFSAKIADLNNDGYADLAGAATTSTGYPTGKPNFVFYNKGYIGIKISAFNAAAARGNIAVTWEADGAYAGFNLYRSIKNGAASAESVKLNAELIGGRPPYRFVDANVKAGVAYQYWLEAVDGAGVSEVYGPAECTARAQPGAFALRQNYPNPARNGTTIKFSLPAAAGAELAVYDMAGRKVKTAFAGSAHAGETTVALDVSRLAPGVYTYRLAAAGATATRRMVVAK